MTDRPAPGSAAAILAAVSICLTGISAADVFYGSTAWGGAKSLALGEACGAVMTDAESVFHTPAGIGFLREPQFIMSHTIWGEDTPTETGAVALPLGKFGAIGLGGFYQSLGDIEERDFAGNFVRTFSLDTYAGTLCYARRIISSLSAGISGGIVSQQAGELKAKDSSFGTGLIWIFGKWVVGISGMDLSSEMPAYHFSAARIVETAGLGMTLAAGGIFREYGRRLGVGLDMKLNSIVSLRGGYQITLADGGAGNSRNLSAGMGLQYTNLGLDYAFLTLGDVGRVHRFQVRFMATAPDDKVVQPAAEEPNLPPPEQPVYRITAETPPPPPPPQPALPSAKQPASATMSPSADSGPKEEISTDFVFPSDSGNQKP